MSKISNDYSAPISVTKTANRATPLPAGRQFGEVAKRVGLGLVRGVESISSFAPGGAMISGSLRAGGTLGMSRFASATTGQSVEVPGASNAADILAGGQDLSPTELIAFQRQVNQEQLTYSTVSNVMKARHDSAKQVTNNMR